MTCNGGRVTCARRTYNELLDKVTLELSGGIFRDWWRHTCLYTREVDFPGLVASIYNSVYKYEVAMWSLIKNK